MVKDPTGMKIVVCVKYVPDASGDIRFEPDGTVDAASTASYPSSTSKPSSRRCGSRRSAAMRRPRSALSP
jgi:hypothetical protein